MTGSLSNIRKNRRHKSHLLEDEKSREAQNVITLFRFRFRFSWYTKNPEMIGA
jgi:hypothetical protein